MERAREAAEIATVDENRFATVFLLPHAERDGGKKEVIRRPRDTYGGGKVIRRPEKRIIRRPASDTQGENDQKVPDPRTNDFSLYR